jgi:hypothetical protein
LIGVENVAHSGAICAVCAAHIGEYENSIQNSKWLTLMAEPLGNPLYACCNQGDCVKYAPGPSVWGQLAQWGFFQQLTWIVTALPSDQI